MSALTLKIQTTSNAKKLQTKKTLSEFESFRPTNENRFEQFVERFGEMLGCDVEEFCLLPLHWLRYLATDQSFQVLHLPTYPLDQHPVVVLVLVVALPAVGGGNPNHRQVVCNLKDLHVIPVQDFRDSGLSTMMTKTMKVSDYSGLATMIRCSKKLTLELLACVTAVEKNLQKEFWP